MINICRFFPSCRHLPYGIVLMLQTSFFLTSPTVAAQDALEQSVAVSPLARYSLLMDIDRVGDNLIVVGERGHILISQDQAASWTQADVPVRVTLTATFFINEQRGWAVGHDGVVLRTDDGGQHWQKLLDGNQANQLMFTKVNEAFARLETDLASAQSAQDNALIEELTFNQEDLMIQVDDAQSFIDEGPTRPFLDVWFKDTNEGFIVGAFGLILHTLDGGDSWQSWSDRVENPELFHLNALTAINGKLYLAAEAGSLYRSDDDGQHWTLLDSPYQGSFFGLVAVGKTGLIAYGLRGNAYVSNDNGTSWTKIDTGVDASLFAGTMLTDNISALVGAGGVILYIDSEGNRLAKRQHPRKFPISAVIAGPETALLTAGFGGIYQAKPLTRQEQDHE